MNVHTGTVSSVWPSSRAAASSGRVWAQQSGIAGAVRDRLAERSRVSPWRLPAPLLSKAPAPS